MSGECATHVAQDGIVAKVVHKAGRWCMLGRGSANLDGGMEEGSRETSELAAAGGREHGAAVDIATANRARLRQTGRRGAIIAWNSA